jgi:hypothetical protein
MSWVELDGIVSEEIVRDDDIRRRVAASGRPLRSHATGMSDDDLLAKLRGLGVDADREKLAGSLDQSIEVTPRDGGTHPAAAFRLLNRSYLILDMHIRAMTCRNVVRGKTTFWLHSLGRRGERAVRRRSLVIKELSSSTPSLVFLATFFGRFCEVFAGHRPFTADTPT